MVPEVRVHMERGSSETRSVSPEVSVPLYFYEGESLKREGQGDGHYKKGSGSLRTE